MPYFTAHSSLVWWWINNVKGVVATHTPANSFHQWSYLVLKPTEWCDLWNEKCLDSCLFLIKYSWPWTPQQSCINVACIVRRCITLVCALCLDVNVCTIFLIAKLAAYRLDRFSAESANGTLTALVIFMQLVGWVGTVELTWQSGLHGLIHNL